MKEQNPEAARPGDATEPDTPFCEMCNHGYQAEDAPTRPHLLTKREVEVLDRMRRIKEEARETRRRLADTLPQQTQEREGLFLRLSLLKKQWQDVDRERIDAAEERMRLLGHSPD